MLLNIQEAAFHCGFRSRSQIYKLIDGGRIDEFIRVDDKGKKRIEREGLRDYLAGSTQQRSDGNVCEIKPELDIDAWSRMADAANELMDEMGWLVSSPNTMAEWSLIYEVMEKARQGT